MFGFDSCATAGEKIASVAGPIATAAVKAVIAPAEEITLLSIASSSLVVDFESENSVPRHYHIHIGADLRRSRAG
jgi:hypothetical protein